VDFEYFGEGKKRCTNCRQVLPLRQVKPTGALTPSQQQVIDQIVGLGWILEKQEFIGRGAWVVFKHPTRHWMLGDSVYGSIGVRGGFKLDFPQFNSKTKVLTDDIGLRVYLGS
jgi:hypothetical protein